MDILKKLVGVVKGMIILDIYLLVIFTPYYDPSSSLWEVVAKSMSYCW